MTACGNENNNGISQQNQPNSSTTDTLDSSAGSSNVRDEGGTKPASENEDVQGSNILVAYFSRVGNTVWEDGVDAVTSASLTVEDGEFVGNAEYLARMAQEATGGDLFLIQTEETYPSDYRKTTNVASDEQADNARPALASHVENMDQYDTIVLIYPNWWGTLPQPLFTFLEEYDFSGKTILPLCTHEGSHMGSSERAIAELCPDAILLDGLSVRGSSASSAQSDIEIWINNSVIFK
ncbi:MAG: NAD(P)H-dependent oxidoreductase [Acetatifactor sp.]|nr:NAD(P)H-dependent oxidoreductase [Acetatifactor sp.]